MAWIIIVHNSTPAASTLVKHKACHPKHRTFIPFIVAVMPTRYTWCIGFITRNCTTARVANSAKIKLSLKATCRRLASSQWLVVWSTARLDHSMIRRTLTSANTHAATSKQNSRARRRCHSATKDDDARRDRAPHTRIIGLLTATTKRFTPFAICMALSVRRIHPLNQHEILPCK